MNLFPGNRDCRPVEPSYHADTRRPSMPKRRLDMLPGLRLTLGVAASAMLLAASGCGTLDRVNDGPSPQISDDKTMCYDTGVLAPDAVYPSVDGECPDNTDG